jgi:hypothetical protein
MARRSCILAVLALAAHAAAGSAGVVDIGSRLELFVDGHLVDTLRGATQKLHAPIRADVALRFDRPWEGPASSSVHVFSDGDVYRMYYRGCRDQARWSQRVQCYAESEDGIHWVRPELGLHEFEGSKRNNILFGRELVDTNLAPFRDPNPDVPAAERYKAIAGFVRHHEGVRERRAAVAGLVSSDGIRWRLIQPEPIFVAPKDDKAFDAQQVAFWDSNLRKYVAYCRGWRPHRVIRRTTSDDFRTWSGFEYLDYGDAPPEHFYTCMVAQYARAPHVYLGIEKRFLPDRKAVPGHPVPGTSDAVFMSSRDGVRFDRRFLESWIRPGLDRDNWTDRSFQVAWDLLRTGPAELSLFWIEAYRHAGCRVQRGTLRLDGFVSIHAGYGGGELVTKPLRFEGRGLVLNYATSAAGSVRVEIQDRRGKPIPGFELEDCEEIYGDEIERAVVWKGGADVGALAGKPVRLRFHLKDADLFALRFQPERPRYAGPAVLPADPCLDFPGGRVTVEAFVYVEAPVAARILSKYAHRGGDSRRGWEWNMLPDGRFRFRVNQGAYGERTLLSKEPLPRREWVHVATVFDRPNRRMRLYVDGELAVEREIPDAPIRATPDQALFLGRYGGSDTALFRGRIDELRLTAAALEFEGPPRKPYSGRERSTLALYHFDELIDEGSVAPNAARKSKLRSPLRIPGEGCLGESLPGFGRALDLPAR